MINFDKIGVIATLLTDDLPQMPGSNAAPMIDYAGRLRQHIKELTAIEKALTKTLTGDVELTGETEQGKCGELPGVNFIATITEAIRWSLDTKAVKEEMGDTWYDAHCRTTPVRTVKYNER